MTINNLQGRTAIISGGLGDIGRASALELARRGADIALCDVRPEVDAKPLLAEIGAAGRRGHYARVDVVDAYAVRSWVDTVERELATPDLVIVNAAIVAIRPFESLEPEYWRRELSVNLDGAFHLASAATRKLLQRGLTGRVVFVGSWAAEHVHLQIPTYCVAKAGIRTLSRCMAANLAPHGILVNEISPGFVDAGLAAQFMQNDPAVRESSRLQVPIGLLIEPPEVATQIAHLCDPANRHMTGTTLMMDGGLSLRGSGMLDQGNQA